MSETERGLPVSPCIRICCLDEQDVCLGCFRSIGEITGWAQADEVARLAILSRCDERRAEHDRRFPEAARLKL